MANKQINELTEIVAATDDDLLLVYDVDEAGSEKSKKIKMEDFCVTGTFTPEVADAVTGGNTASIATNIGTYTKIGRLVIVECTILNIDTTDMTGNNTLYIRNLPYSFPTLKSTTSAVSLGHVSFSGTVTTYGVPSTSYVRLLQSTSGAEWSTLNVSALTSGSADIVFTLIYSI